MPTRPTAKPRATRVPAPTAASFGSRWFEHAWRRSTIDMHIPDWDPEFMSKFDPEACADAFARSRAQSVLAYGMSHTGRSTMPRPSACSIATSADATCSAN